MLTAPVPLPRASAQIGCYADNAGGVRALPNAALTVVITYKEQKYGPIFIRVPVVSILNTGYTPASCAAWAKAKGYFVFGLQAGGACYGSSDLGVAISQGPSTACSAACTTSTATACGATNVNAVFTVV